MHASTGDPAARGRQPRSAPGPGGWLRRTLPAHWHHRCPVTVAMLPLAALYAAAVVVRRLLYAAGVFRTQRLPVPVVVIGNLTVGGTGKTPLVVWLTQWLQARGHHPGVLLRGYGRSGKHTVRLAGADSDPVEVGDEAVLIATRADCPVAVGADRVAAGRRLLQEAPRCDVLVCDDGLQHLALARAVEVAVVDGERRLGNGWWLPAGPLRESASRLRQVDVVVCHGGRPRDGEVAMRLSGESAVPLSGREERVDVRSFRDEPVHAVAGIGNPERFFRYLEGLGLEVVRHPFPDHHAFTPAELDFGDGRRVIMTEKDAVKCRGFDLSNAWYLPVDAEPDERLGELVLARLPGAIPAGRRPDHPLP